MFEKVTNYFDNVVMPEIRRKHAEILPEMCIWVQGSVGFGIDDELSDLDANIYLKESSWKEYGSTLQLSMNKLVSDTNPYLKAGSGIYVQPLSWLLDFQGEKFLDSAHTPSWSKVSIEWLFTVQESLIIHDPLDRLHHLREVTAPAQRPEALWKKSLLLELKAFIEDGYHEFRRNVLRGHLAEVCISFGCVIEKLYHIGFLIVKQYYPWRTHLRWAFERLPEPFRSIGMDIDKALIVADWQEKMEIVKTVFDAYRSYINKNAIFPEIDLSTINLDDSGYAEELIWAERLNAWEKPAWREWITSCMEKAVQDGNSPEDFWVYSLWNMM
jgi:hypothetical protein